jgi:hypothetical protein
VTFKTTKIQLPINQIDYQNIATFGRGITLPNLEWGQTPSTTLDMKTQTLNPCDNNKFTMGSHTHEMNILGNTNPCDETSL